MANDWTIGVEITDIVEVIAGEDVAGTDMVLVTTEDGVWSGTDVTTFATLSWTALVSGGKLAKAMYVGNGKFVTVSDNGKVYELSFETAGGPPVITTVYDDDNGAGTAVSAVAHAEAVDLIVFAQQSKVYTVPVGGGTVTQRMDTASVIEAGSKVFDVDYGPNGWTLLVEKADYSVATVIASADWGTVDTTGFATDITDSPLAEVNYYEDVDGGTWMAGREDGEVIQTTDLDDWKPAADPHTALWTGVGRDGRVLYSSDALTWSEYESPVGETSDYWDISFGKDGSNDDLWIISTNTSPELRMAADPTGGNSSWTAIDFPGSSDLARTVEYSATGTWIAATGDDVFRSTDGGANWTKITAVAAGAGLNLCLATDSAGTWLMGGTLKTLKSYDDGLNWYESTATRANGIEYNNGVWFLAGNGTTSYRITSIANSNTTDTWTAVTGIAEGLWAICHITGNTWMCSNKGNTMYLSTDNCASWSSVTSPSAGQIMALASDGTTIVTGNKNNEVLTSTDLGTTWTQRHTSAEQVLVIEYNKVKPY